MYHTKYGFCRLPESLWDFDMKRSTKEENKTFTSGLAAFHECLNFKVLQCSDVGGVGKKYKINYEKRGEESFGDVGGTKKKMP